MLYRLYQLINKKENNINDLKYMDTGYGGLYKDENADWFKPFNRTLKGTVESMVEKSDTNFDFIYNTFSKDAK